MCTVLLPPGVNPVAVNRYFNIFEGKPEGSIRRGRRRLRWLEHGLRKVKVKRWRQKAFDREEWVSVIKECQCSQKAVEPRSQMRPSNTSKINTS